MTIDLRILPHGTTKTTIAVTGLHGSGKTAFLTSLLWQLQEFERAEFHLKNNAKITHFQEIRPKSPQSRFPFEHYRNVMAAEMGMWPRKTTHDQLYECTFKRSDRPGTQRVKFLDFPGERIADVGIFLHKDLVGWSGYMFGQFDGDSSNRTAVAAFADELRTILAAGDDHRQEDAQALAERVVRSYWTLLARFALDFRFLVSPSTFWLDRQGRRARKNTAEGLAEAQWPDSDESSQFAPLPADLLDEKYGNSPVVQELQRRYTRYRKDVVVPHFKNMAAARGFIVLVDVLSLLLGSVDRYNDNREVLKAWFRAMQKQSSIHKMFRKLWPWAAGVQRIALVATKADRIRQGDLEKGRLKDLLRSMTGRVQDWFPDAEVRWFDCSACVSTEQMDDDKLRGMLARGNPQRLSLKFPVSALPDDWPTNWTPGQYQFPDVLPRTWPNRQVPPTHRNLDAVFDFVTT